jgi:glyoxylase-like metal-dependent hydrolase (beta-lactamase superfamily II)
MAEEVTPHIYRIKVPIPEEQLGYTNCYVVKTDDRNLVIDTGLNIPSCLDLLRRGLADLRVDLERTDIFVTHMHRDHVGLAGELAKEGSRVFMGRHDFGEMRDIERNGRFLHSAAEYSRLTGFPESDLARAFSFFEQHLHRPIPDHAVSLLTDGEVIDVGDFRFQCLVTPGHSKGHVCLYEGSRNILFSGDHILGTITPNVQSRLDGDNPLNDYLSSLRRIHGLDVMLTLPGHRALVHDCRHRIEELIEHHEKRAEEVLSVVKKSGNRSIYSIASRITWSIGSAWNKSSSLQRLFAVGETLSHLTYLEAEGQIRREMGREGIIYYS